MKNDETKLKFFYLIVMSLLLTNCGVQSKKEAEVSSRDKQLCDSLKIDISIVEELRKYSDAKLESFHYSLGRQINEDGSETEIDPIHLAGLVFDEKPERTDLLLDNLQSKLRLKGYTIFVLDENFGISGELDVMAILKTTDKYEILSQIKTDGINYDIDNDSLISLIKVFDAKYSLSLVGASGDWCEFKIEKEPTDWLELANETYAICPDIVDQGTGSVEALAEEMKNTRRLYLWWD
jgi:hypothetical protein